MLVLVASLSLLLAGCGGGGSSTPATTPDPAPPPPPDYSGQLLMYHQAAVEATTKAAGAGMTAAQAVKDATKYSGMLDVSKTVGDSTVAMMNAQMVLDAKDAVSKALMDAEAAKMQAMDAKTAAGAIPDGTAGKARAIAALDEAIKVAEKQVADIMAISTGMNADETDNAVGQALKTAVQAVTGTNTKKPKTAGDVAADVAKAVAGALAPTVPSTVVDATTHDGTALRVEHYATSTAVVGATSVPARADRTIHAHNSLGRYWAEIVGEDNIMMERLGVLDDSGDFITPGNGFLPVASIAGMSASAVNPDGTDLSAAGGSGNLGSSAGAYTDGASTDATDINYKGIPGVAVCLGGSAGCSVNDAGRLGAGWYFTAEDHTVLYILNPTTAARTTTLYVPDIDHAQWGHWLAVAEDGTVTVHTYAYSPGNESGLDLARDTTEGAANTATYTGSAAGMSVHKTFDGNGNQMGINSGAFTADVELTATFGTTPRLSGTVDNFQGGAHTDSGWSVNLQETNLAAGASLTGVAKGSGQAGDWTAQGHGTSGERPTGFFGNFEVHFTDGHASGAYAARTD